MKLKILSILLLMAMAVSAQTEESFEEYKNRLQSEFNKYKSGAQSDFDKYKAEQQAAFDAYRKKINDEYADFLNKAWSSFKAEEATKPVQEPKVEPVKYEPKPQTEPQPEQKPIPVKKETLVIPAPEPAPEPIAPVVVKEDEHITNTEVVFFGTSVTVKIPKGEKFSLKSLSNNDLSDAWKQLSDKKYDVLVNSLIETRKQLNLCDWAYMNLLKDVAEKLYGKGNDAVFLQTFLMTQSGYNVRLARSADSKKLYLLVASQYNIFGMSYYVVGKTKYYAIDCKESSISICEAGYEKEKPLSLQIASQQNFAKNMSQKRKLTSKRGLVASVSINKNNIDFYNTYPTSCINEDFTTKWVAYANTPLEEGVRGTLYPQLKRSVQGMSELEAVNLILNWVQTAFEYGYDDEIWGGDRAFFGDETLFYPYCDCEDRSILFSRLIRDILHLDVVLLYYPGHLATAVRFNEDVKGDYLVCKNQKYIVCDPTYIGAPVGATMPKMNNKEARIVILEK